MLSENSFIKPVLHKLRTDELKKSCKKIPYEVLKYAGIHVSAQLSINLVLLSCHCLLRFCNTDSDKK